MHLGMLEAISIRMEIVSGNFRCLSISNCGFPAPDECDVYWSVVTWGTVTVNDACVTSTQKGKFILHTHTHRSVWSANCSRKLTKNCQRQAL